MQKHLKTHFTISVQCLLVKENELPFGPHRLSGLYPSHDTCVAVNCTSTACPREKNIVLICPFTVLLVIARL